MKEKAETKASKVKTLNSSKPHNSEIEVIRGGCPLCGSDVNGNDEYKFYCRRCNILFERSNLNIEGQKEESKREENKKEEKKERKQKEIEGVQERIFVSSRKSNKYHLCNCPFAQRISEKNKIFFKTSEEAEGRGYKPCSCTISDRI